ncbi:MAG: bifunctional hydroxymethylpyrimidine kinase/phosphomethylpyrimidine kinase [Chthoniobacterales bacterium]|nr:bifunctional hydroxymethylpyrimidine kinase/phosphomethylpyrimidine kinase [Chthoniobacterales bacterium]
MSFLTQPPVVLSIAGSDCSAGAGIQADLKTFSSFGCYGLTAVTCIVAEIPGKVVSIQPIEPKIVRDQIALLFKTYPIAAFKTGMLFSTPIIEVLAEVLGELKSPPLLVIDPVMIASSGDSLLTPDAINAYYHHLFPRASLITPNLDELTFLAGGIKIPRSLEEMGQLGLHLMKKINKPLLLKGGHLKQKEATDLLLMPDGSEELFSAPFFKNAETHGTGCTYSAAITAGLAKGNSLSRAISEAKSFITQAIINTHQWGEVRALKQTR